MTNWLRNSIICMYLPIVFILFLGFKSYINIVNMLAPVAIIVLIFGILASLGFLISTIVKKERLTLPITLLIIGLLVLGFSYIVLDKTGPSPQPPGAHCSLSGGICEKACSNNSVEIKAFCPNTELPKCCPRDILN